MNKLITILSIFIFTSSINAQFSIGAGLGINLSTLNFKDGGLDASKYIASSYMSFLMTVKMGDKFNFNTDISISSKGARDGFGNPLSSFATTTNHRTINLDIIPSIEYKPIPWLGIGVGGYAGLKVFEGIRTAEQGWVYNSLVNYFKNYDVGLNPYLRGYFSKFFVQLGYQIGMIDIYGNRFGGSFGLFNGNGRGRNRNISLGGGMMF